MGVVFLIVIIVIAVWVLASCVRIVPQAYAVILERLGAYQATWSTGIHFKVPFIERVARKVNLKEQVVDFPPQPVITKDNVTMQIDTVVLLSDYRSEALYLRCGESDHGNRESVRNNLKKYYR